MRYRSLRKWDAVAKSGNLLYFAQLLEELLFDYSLDTYKPSAMNTSLLCIEALEIIFEINEGSIKRPNLQHILDELAENLKKDAVSKELISIDLDGIRAVLKNPKAGFHDKKVVVELLSRQIILPKYKKKNEDLLILSILSKNCSMSDIRSLTRSYITTLINIGYSSRYIYNLVHQFFFYGSNRIVGNAAIAEFINKFTSDSSEYLILYRGSQIFQKIGRSCDRFDISITKDISSIEFDISSHNFSLRNDEVYICVDKIKAKDEFSAKVRADELLDLLSTLYTLFHHKQHLGYLRNCITINKENGSIQKSKQSINTMYKCIDLMPDIAAIKLNNFISEFSLNNTSFEKFTRSVELHSLALASDSRENQMINLWIALESIIPTKSDNKNISNIEHIVSSVIPFLSISYLDRLISRFSKDLLYWNKSLIKKMISDIAGKGVTEKLVKLMALPEFKIKRKELLAEFRDFHLLSDRFSYFCTILSNPNNVANLLNTHNQRVEWQIRRIYRARNLIVHSGKTPSYTDILIENTHDYLDVVMGGLMKLATSPKAISSIEQGFKYTELSYASLLKWLSDKSSVFSEESISRIVKKKII